ncbi:MAG: Phenylacetic acid degradation-related protein [Thermodesulfobacterium sp. 37_54]|jgi:acyl-CoA thioesterase|nr:MAG: Phenylacetic acid degradation-related protein [Thermodesulfobacterium sp. 37_54]KUK37468.1 MAG: Phenylacetic acid degradation-related protein [Thermodesulfobacterium commune]HCE79512.1 phenylacetic acid degradation protein [Thermodesulfobacterium commune]
MEASRKEQVWKIAKFMREHDRVAVWLGVDLIEVDLGYALIGMKVREDVLNAAGVCQGGAIFSLADFAFAVASNSHGKLALAISSSIYFPSSAKLGEYLYAEAKELSLTKRIGLYEVRVFEKETGRLVAIFTGQVYRKEGGLEGFNI